ncbi:MAG: arylsulfatase A-like enzyme [Candidatus Paceibacteria bacterium]
MWKDQILPTSLPTVAEVLHTAGYRTAAFAEGGYLSVAHGFSRGHEVYNSKSRDCSLTFAAAQEWIARQDSPYFAFVHTYQVHSPYDPPAEYRKRFVRPYSGSLPEVVDAPDYPWGHGGKPPELEDQRYITDLYDAEVAYLDAELGRFLESLEESDSLDNTLLLITSDHGEEFFEHGAALHGMSLYQEQLHVPLILHWPGHLEGGLAPAHGVHAVDVAPTLLAAAGVSAPKHWVGEPLRTEAGPSTRPLFMPMKTLWSDPKRVGESAVSLREGKFKYITYPAGLRRFDAHSGASLFDLAHDPGEARNLLDPEQALEWGRKLSALYERFPAVQSGGVAEHDAATQAELQKLGYAGQDNSKE